MKIKCMIDSGAYSAFRLGKQIDIKQYCAYLHANLDWIDSYVNLDHIDPNDTATSARVSFENLLTMRAAGLDPIPVFHAGEDISWLYRMLDLGCTYAGLAASAMNIRGKVDDWYAGAWQPLADKNGLPIVKVHGFGEGRLDAQIRFPWYSTDSASWLFEAQFTNSSSNEKGISIATFKSALERNKEEQIVQSKKRFLRETSFFTKRGQGPSIPSFVFRSHLAMGGNEKSFPAVALSGHTNILLSYHTILGRNSNVSKFFRSFMSDPIAVCIEASQFASRFSCMKEYYDALK